MKKRFPALLTTLIWTALYSQPTLSDTSEVCLLGVPTYNHPLVTGNVNTLPVTIHADQSSAYYPDKALFTGNVKIRQGNSLLTANEVELRQIEAAGQEPTRMVTARGDVFFSDNQVQLQGPEAWSNLNTKDTDIYQATYQMVGRQGRGDADKMQMRDNNRYTILENGSFTSCLPDDNSWRVEGSRVIQDRDEQVVEVWNARFKIGDVPVFYSPYMQLPVGDKRRSGFLIPNAKYGSSNGFELLLPYYWNIAPNYDATFTPHYMSKRGLQWQTEFRYLTAPGAGLMAVDWLPQDKQQYSDAQARWLLYWQHAGVLDSVWRFNIDYTKVSDSHYFTDLSSKYGSTTDGYATQKFSVGYADTHWDLALATKSFQVFTDAGNQNAYRAQPQLDINYYQQDIGPFDLHTYAQAAKLTSINVNNPEVTRLHLEPRISVPLSNSWGNLNTEAKVMTTHYQQTIPDGFSRNYQALNNRAAPDLDESFTRVIPEFKVDGTMIFERQMNLLSDYAQGNYTQTLEPRVQYLNVGYRDQSHIYTYDSTLLQTDYTGLFRDRTYSGLDRIASANQLSSGLTTRIYDDSLAERFNASAGQIYYFSRPRTGDESASLDRSHDTGSLVWAGNSSWRINQHWGVRGGVQYDARLSSIALGDAVAEYRRDSDRVMQLNYRYASSEYIKATLPNIVDPGYQNGISQVGATAGWPVVDRWAVVGAYYYDTRAKQTASQLVGLQYNNCCWNITLGYERKITSWDYPSQRSQYDNQITFNIQLRGLSNDHSLGTQGMMRSGILPYQRAF